MQHGVFLASESKTDSVYVVDLGDFTIFISWVIEIVLHSFVGRCDMCVLILVYHVGEDVQTVYAGVKSAVALNVYNNYSYWYDSVDQRINRLDRTNSSALSVLQSNIDSMKNLVVHHKSRQTGTIDKSMLGLYFSSWIHVCLHVVIPLQFHLACFVCFHSGVNSAWIIICWLVLFSRLERLPAE